MKTCDDQPSDMQAEEWEVHAKAIRSLAVRLERYGESEQSETQHRCATEMELRIREVSAGLKATRR
jgi:hypothetical protein